MGKIWILFLLGINAWLDLKKREINLILTIFLALYGCFCIVTGGEIWTDYLLAIGISGMFIGLSFVSHGGIGMGDALLLLALGVNLPMDEYLVMLCMAFLLAAMWASCLMIFMKKGKKTEIPFVPFLLFGFVGGLALCA